MNQPSPVHVQQPPSPQQDQDKKRTSARLVLLGLAAAVLLGGGGWLLHHQLVGKYVEGTDDAYLHADDVTVAPRIGGYVAQVLVKDNQSVVAGQPLVRIDPRDYHAQAEQYQAQIDIARADADTIRAQIDEQQATVAQLRAQLAAALDNAAFAQREVQRYAPLVEMGAENAEALATRRNQADHSARQVAAQQAALANAQRHIVSLQAKVRQAEVQSGTARAQLKAADVNLESTVLRASVAGRLGDHTVRAGQFIQPGTRLMTIVPLGTLYVTANFKETQIGRMAAGQPAEIAVDAFPGLVLHGRVESLAPGTGAQFSLLPPQNATGNFTKIVQRVPVRIALDASDETRRVLLPGLSLKVEVDTSGAKDAVDRIRRNEQARAEQRQ